MRLLAFVGGLALAAAIVGGAQAAVVNWTLQDVSLADGSAVSGTFGFDADADLYSNVDIAVAGGPSFPTASNFTISIPVNGGATEPYWLQVVPGSFSGDATGLEQLFLVFTAPLSDGGGTVAISSEFGSPQLGVCGDPLCRTNDPGFPEVYGGDGQGFVTTQPTTGVPEPAAWTLMLLGCGGMGAALRMRRDPICA